MKKSTKFVMTVLLVSCAFCWAGDLETLCQKLPDDTFGFVATSGMRNFEDDFQNSILGQIAADPQVKTFFEQLIGSISKSEDLLEIAGQGEKYVEFIEGLLQSPTVLAVAPYLEELPEEVCALLLSEAIDPDSSLGKLFEETIQAELESKKIIRKDMHGCKVYVSNDPNACETYYIAQSNDFFLAVFDDDHYVILEQLAADSPNLELADKLSDVPSANDALVLYINFQKFMAILKEEAAVDSESQQAMDVFRSLGIADTQHYVVKAGFEGENLVMDGKIKTPVSGGIWDALVPVDKSLFEYVDPKAMQASAVSVDPTQLYDIIFNCVTLLTSGEINTAEQVAEFEAMLDFEVRDDFLAGLDGSFMGYMLPPYASPELLTGGYVLIAELKDAEKFKRCMLSLETLIKTMAPAQQVQISSQKTASDQEIHIWAVGVMAMMQIIPSWAIENDTLIFTSHPNVTKNVIERIASGGGESMISKPEYANAMNKIPADSFMINLSDSKAQARQLMKSLQQFWPMLNMGLMQEGIQLPIMLPSIEPYIEQMDPGFNYARKVTDGIEFHYEGTGLEATSGGAAGGAMGMAILMPALGKTKKISQRVVSGTNLKGIGTASLVYANDYEGRFPTDFQALIDECDVSPKSLVSPRKPNNFDGPSYILIQGLTDAAPANAVLVYENPAFCNDDQVNVLYVDGHVAAETKEQLKQDLQKTYEYLKKPIPQLDW